MSDTCCNMRPPKKSKLPPGQQKWKRCQQRADLRIDLHQAAEHQKVGNGWFEIPMCDRCFKEGMANR